jgi:hypothetical protein
VSSLLNKPVRAAWSALAVAAVVALAFLAMRLLAQGTCMLGLQFAGSGEAFSTVLATECAGEPVRAALWLDFVFIAVYAAGLATLCWIGSTMVYTGRGAHLLVIARRSVIVAAIADVLENAMTLVAVDAASSRDTFAPAIEAAAHVKWVGAAFAVVGSAVVVAGVVPRLAAARHDEQQAGELAGTPAGSAAASEPGSVWAQNYRVPPPETPSERPPSGICLSGGGIRSATFSMGAMQAFARRSLLERVDYLSVVSGGSYFGGAQQMIRARAAMGDHQVPVGLTDAFAPGSPEEDRARRHGKYIADGGWEWMGAVGVVARNVLLGLTLIFAALVVLGRVLGATYSTAGGWAERVFAPVPAEVGWVWPDFTAGSWLALLGTFGLAALAWILSGLPKDPPEHLVVRNHRWDVRHALCNWAGLLAFIACGVWAGAFLGPALVRFSEWSGDRGSDITLPELAPLLGLATVGVTVWNMVTKGIGHQDGASTATTSRLQRFEAKASFATRAVLSAAVVLGLVLLALATFAGVLHRAVRWHLADRGGVDWWLVVAVGVLVLVGLFFDQTRMSMHVFYKRRLAQTFAVERVSPTRAEAIDYDIGTTLSSYGKPPATQPAGPELLICAAANVSGPDLAPPGRRVTPVVFSWRYIGGPRLGYVGTQDYEQIVKHTSYEHDATLMSAMAVSGAAFASAMGRMSTPFDVLLSLSNARLGSWLPNPAYLVARSRANGRATFADATELAPLEELRKRLPRVRRINYWAREIFGVYSPRDRFVYVSDGGHYENLGLVELLRRRCETVYCVDASGDSMTATLAQAAVLAWEELGIRISVAGFDLAPHSAVEGTKDNVELRKLQKRLASTSVVSGTIDYPAIDGLPAMTGNLVIGKAVLTEDLEFPLQAHAMKSGNFPGDTTADQWFGVDQFNAYHALGSAVGNAMLDVPLRPGPVSTLAVGDLPAARTPMPSPDGVPPVASSGGIEGAPQP